MENYKPLHNNQRVLLYSIRKSTVAVMLSPYLGYCDSDSRHFMAEGLQKRTAVNVSFETLDNMISRPSIYSMDKDVLLFLKEIRDELKLYKREYKNLVGFRFYYDLNCGDCNVYCRLKNGACFKLMPFPIKNQGRSEMVTKVFQAFVPTYRSAQSKVDRGYAIRPVKGKVWPLIDPLSADIQVLIRRHPELETVFSRMGFSFVDVPVPVGTYLVKPKDTLVRIAKKYGACTAWQAIPAFNAEIEDPRMLKWGAELKIPMPFAVPKKVLKWSDVYNVQKGDTLEGIADMFYGNKKLWGMIYLLNKDKITVPDKIEAGILLSIPSKEFVALPAKPSFVTFKQTYVE